MQTERYSEQQEHLPDSGQYIIADATETTIKVYQAYKPSIAAYAVANQRFGGKDFSFSRMTWIKPNFMWMMYRSGWAQKKDQERILQLELSLEGFEAILAEAVPSSYSPGYYKTREEWTAAVQHSNVRLQWDPDHAPDGSKLTRRAIQLGIRGTSLDTFNQEYILAIKDVTDFVLEQSSNIGKPELVVPVERVVSFSHRPDLLERIGLDG